MHMCVLYAGLCAYIYYVYAHVHMYIAPFSLPLTLTSHPSPPPPPPSPDIIVDMLGNLKFRNILIEHYKESREPKWVKRAIKEALYDANMSLYSKEATDGG